MSVSRKKRVPVYFIDPATGDRVDVKNLAELIEKENMLRRSTGKNVMLSTGKNLGVIITNEGTLLYANSKQPLRPMQVDEEGNSYYLWANSVRLYPHLLLKDTVLCK